jgi:hypothetical protein
MINLFSVCYVWYCGAQTQFRSYGTKTGKMILADLWYYKLKASPGVKITSPASAKRCLDSSNSTHLVASYNYAGLTVAAILMPQPI